MAVEAEAGDVVEAQEPIVNESDHETSAEAGQETGQESGQDAPTGEASEETPEGEPEQPNKKVPKWLNDRLGRATREKSEAQRAAEDAKAEAERVKAENKRFRALLEAEGKTPSEDPTAEPPKPTTPDEIRRLAAEMAAQDKEAERIKNESARVMSDGAKLYGADKWESARQEFVNNFGQDVANKPEFFDAIFGLEDGAKVFYELANNPDETDRILALSPARMGIEIAKIANKPAPTKKISAAPAPIQPLNGSARVTRSIYDGDISDEDFIRIREEQLAARAKR